MLPVLVKLLRYGAEVFHSLKGMLNEQGKSTAVGDEGGFAPDFERSEDAIEFILRAIEKAGFKPGDDIYLGMDIASSEFYREQGEFYTFEEKYYDNGGFFACVFTTVD